MRAKYFEDSKKAFEKGEKALAKELSDKGKKETELMEAAQKKASKAIFDTKYIVFFIYANISEIQIKKTDSQSICTVFTSLTL